MKIIAGLLLVAAFSYHGFAQEYYGPDDSEAMSKKAEGTASEDGRKVLETGRTMTLDNKEILPGGCWDYANAVFNRAGYASEKRENVYKTVKAGPYADVGKIQYGDWLYYVNHSYGDIEHSAIFVDWIDKDQKIGLMLSYGGENRHTPARYLPYDLSSVYGITRPKAKLGEKKTNTSSSASGKSKDVAVTAKNGSTVVSNDDSAAKEISGVTVNGMKVESLKFGTNVSKLEIVGEGTSFSSGDGRVYCWLRVVGGQGKFVKLKWYQNGNPIGDIQLDIKYNPMRTYAYRTIAGRTGTWTVEVVDPTGTVLHSANFTVN